MDDKKREEFVDELLDASLSRYSSVEPRPGLEARVLAGLREQERRAPRPWGSWVVVGAATAALVVGLLGFYLTRSRTELAPSAPPVVARITEAPATTPPLPATPAVVRRPASRAAAPRQAEFPTPSPLSEQELLLLHFLNAAPPDVVLARWGDSKPIEPLRIEPLRIAPLGAPGTGSNSSEL